jgi:hypothetical protein
VTTVGDSRGGCYTDIGIEFRGYWQNLLAEVGGEGVLRGFETLEKAVNY